MVIENVISDRLKGFIERETLVQADNLPPITEIEKDLGVTDDDAIDFINAFGVGFSVDISEYETSKHFGSEVFNIPDFVKRFFLGDSFQKKIPLTLRELELAIACQKLS